MKHSSSMSPASPGTAPGTLYGVSLGPGDPELITLKALRTLERADAVYYPGTLDSQGGVSSVALPILRANAIPEGKLRLMAVPMSRNRRTAEASYAEHWLRIAADCRAGRTVAVVTIGDAGFYSTVSPMLEMAERDGIPYSVIAGVPAFIAAGAAARMALALQDDRVVVLAMVDDVTELERHIDQAGTVVLMKLSTVRDGLVDWLGRKGIPFVYAEKVGMEGEFITSDLEALRGRAIPYFSLLVCSRHCRRSTENMEHQ